MGYLVWSPMLVRIGKGDHMQDTWYIWFGQGGRYILVRIGNTLAGVCHALIYK